MKPIFLICAILVINFTFAQDSQKDDLDLDIKKDYEIYYSVSGGNIFVFRLLKEGIIVKRYFRKKSKVKTLFLPLEHLDYKKYNRVQYYIDSINMMEYSPMYNDSIVPRLGFQSSFEITNRITESEVVIKHFDSLYDERKLIKLVELLNDILPKKYQKKYQISGWG